ncbi:MAG: hypothetical protein ABFD79_14670 [Phycisphaerales bacterium]
MTREQKPTVEDIERAKEYLMEIWRDDMNSRYLRNVELIKAETFFAFDYALNLASAVLKVKLTVDTPFEENDNG